MNRYDDDDAIEEYIAPGEAGSDFELFFRSTVDGDIQPAICLKTTNMRGDKCYIAFRSAHAVREVAAKFLEMADELEPQASA